jgi:hypothetical protein
MSMNMNFKSYLPIPNQNQNQNSIHTEMNRELNVSSQFSVTSKINRVPGLSQIALGEVLFFLLFPQSVISGSRFFIKSLFSLFIFIILFVVSLIRRKPWKPATSTLQGCLKFGSEYALALDASIQFTWLV